MSSRPNKQRLGRGLSALLGEAQEPARPDGGDIVRTVPVSRIAPNRYQPRRIFAAEDLADLETSIRSNGLLQPLVVRPAPDDAPEGAEWELVAGERRWRAVRRIGWSEVPVVVRSMDDRTLLVLAIVENIQRENLSPIEEAEGYRELIDEFGYSQREIAESVGKDRSTVTNLLRLLKLPARVRGMLTEETLQMGHARALLALDDERAAVAIAERAAREGWSVREVERRVRERRPATTAAGNEKGASKKGRTGDGSDPEVRRVEAALQRRFATKARVRTTARERGTIEIPFHDTEDFGRIVDILLDTDPS